MKSFAITASVYCLVLLGCNGTETQNPASATAGPLAAFGNSGCKKEILAVSAGTANTFSPIDAGGLWYGDEVAGLKCVAWELSSDGRLKVNLINFEGACGAEWQGQATVDSTGLRLGLANPQCYRCGTCIYDWSFEVTGISGNQNLPLTINIETCPGEQNLITASVVLPLSAQPSGIKCRYADFSALALQATSLGTCGTTGMPCTGTAMCSSLDASAALSCQGALNCTDNGNPSQLICAKACSSDADCGPSGITSCQGSFCRPANIW